MSEHEDSISDDIRAAFTEVETGAPPEPKAAPEPQQQPEPPASDGPARAADGKFAPKPKDVLEAQTDGRSVEQVTEAAAKPPIAPPPDLSAQTKAQWSTFSPEIQADLDRRYRETQDAIQSRADKLKGYEPIEAALAPVRAQNQLRGQSDAQYVGALVAADQLLGSDDKGLAQQALFQLARQYGIPLQGMQPGAGQQPQPTQAQPNLDQHVATLVERQLVARMEAEANTRVQGDVEAFAKDPAHVYFENVRPRMGALLSSGQAADLKDAYDQACWADPIVRPLLIKAQTEDAAKASRDAQAARTTQARRAGGSVTGSPGPSGSAMAAASNPNSSTRDDVRAAYDEVMGRA